MNIILHNTNLTVPTASMVCWWSIGSKPVGRAFRPICNIVSLLVIVHEPRWLVEQLEFASSSIKGWMKLIYEVRLSIFWVVPCLKLVHKMACEFHLSCFGDKWRLSTADRAMQHCFEWPGHTAIAAQQYLIWVVWPEIVPAVLAASDRRIPDWYFELVIPNKTLKAMSKHARAKTNSDFTGLIKRANIQIYCLKVYVSSHAKS